MTASSLVLSNCDLVTTILGSHSLDSRTRALCAAVSPLWRSVVASSNPVAPVILITDGAVRSHTVVKRGQRIFQRVPGVYKEAYVTKKDLVAALESAKSSRRPHVIAWDLDKLIAGMRIFGDSDAAASSFEDAREAMAEQKETAKACVLLASVARTASYDVAYCLAYVAGVLQSPARCARKLSF